MVDLNALPPYARFQAGVVFLLWLAVFTYFLLVWVGSDAQ